MKTKFLIILTSVFLAGRILAVPTVLQTNWIFDGGGTGHILTLPSVAQHSLLVCGIRAGGPSATLQGLTDSVGNTWELTSGCVSDSVPNQYCLAYVRDSAASAGAYTLTVNFTAGGSGRIGIMEISGCITATPLDKVASAVGTGINIASGATSATSEAGELGVGFLGSENAGTFSPGSGWTERVVIPGAPSTKAYLETQIVSSTTTINATGTNDGAGPWGALCATFKAGVPTTPTPTPSPSATPTPTPSPCAKGFDLKWDYVGGTGNIAGFKVKSRKLPTSPYVYTSPLIKGQTHFGVPQDLGLHYFTVFAYDSANRESQASNEIACIQYLGETPPTPGKEPPIPRPTPPGLFPWFPKIWP